MTDAILSVFMYYLVQSSWQFKNSIIIPFLYMRKQEMEINYFAHSSESKRSEPRSFSSRAVALYHYAIEYKTRQ